MYLIIKYYNSRSQAVKESRLGMNACIENSWTDDNHNILLIQEVENGWTGKLDGSCGNG